MVRSKRLMKTRLTAYTFLFPNILGFVVFILLPVVFSFAMSFTNWDGYNWPDFIGLKNFGRMINSESFRISLVNTLIFSFFSVPFTIAISTLMAVGMNVPGKGVYLFRLLIFVPYVSSTIAIAAVWNLILHPTMGPVNHLLMDLGIRNPPGWFSSSASAMSGVIIISIWKHLGYFMVIMLAALQGIPRSLYECSLIDGANPRQQFFKITLPMLSPALFFASVIGIINSFKVFDLIYALTEGGPGRATNVLAFTIYQEAFIRFRFGYASSLALFLFLIIMIVTYIQFRGQKKWVHYV